MSSGSAHKTHCRPAKHVLSDVGQPVAVESGLPATLNTPQKK